MTNIFGFASNLPVTTRLDNGYNLFDWVVQENSVPKFWGRTLLGKNQISTEEIEFLRGKQCKIALIIDNLSETVNGSDDAAQAAKTAKALGVPQNKGIVLFAKIDENIKAKNSWTIAFASELSNMGYTPGFICNNDQSSDFDYYQYIYETRNAGNYCAVCWATEPKMEGMPVEWTPLCPSAMTPSDIGLWSAGQIRFGDVSADKVYACNASILECMW